MATWQKNPTSASKVQTGSWPTGRLPAKRPVVPGSNPKEMQAVDVIIAMGLKQAKFSLPSAMQKVKTDQGDQDSLGPMDPIQTTELPDVRAEAVALIPVAAVSMRLWNPGS